MAMLAHWSASKIGVGGEVGPVRGETHGWLLVSDRGDQSDDDFLLNLNLFGVFWALRSPTHIIWSPHFFFP